MYRPIPRKTTPLPIIPVALILTLAILPASPALAQAEAGPQATDSQRLYQQLYQAAMEDSVISPEEERLLRTTQEALGLHEDVIGEALGDVVRPLVPTLDQSGRWTLVAQNMGWGAGLYGWGLPFVLDVNDPKWYVGGVMSSLAASFYLTWRYTEDMHLPEGRSQMQRYGSGLGLQTGRALNYLLGFWDNDDLDRTEMLIIMGTVPLGGYLGDRLYRQWQPSTGMAYALSLYGEVGSSLMNAFFLTAESPPEEEDYWIEEEPYGWVTTDYEAYDAAYREYNGKRLLYRLAGNQLGFWLGHHQYADRQYTFGDAALLAVGRAAGAFYGVMLSNLLGLYDSDAENLARFMVNGSAMAGLAAADRFMRGKDYTFGQSALLGLGGVAGGSLAVGTLIVMEVNESKIFDLAVIGGSLAGFYFTRNIVHPVPETTASAAEGHERLRTSLALRPALIDGQLHPTANLQLRW
ncbi:hypothetical protein ACFL5M_02300 [Candidatus Neomarinimicrobiota bacterium]